MRIFSRLIYQFFVPFLICLGTSNLYASNVDLIETFGSSTYLLQQPGNLVKAFVDCVQYVTKVASFTQRSRTIRIDICGLYIKAPVGTKIALIQTPESSISSIQDVKDHEFTPSAFGKEQKIYNLIQAIHNITKGSTDTFDVYFNNYPMDIDYIKDRDSGTVANSWMSHAAYYGKKNLINLDTLGSLDSLLETGTYHGFFNDYLSKLRAIGINNLTKPETLLENDPIGILYAVTQIGSRGLNPALITKIASNATKITEEDAYSILKSSECLIDSLVGSETSAVASASGTLLEQWNFLKSAQTTTTPVSDTLSGDASVSVSSTLQNVIKLINENYSTLKNADLVTLYNKLIPVTRPIQDAISTEDIQNAYNQDDLSLQEYIYYLLTGVAPEAEIETTKQRIITCCESIVELLDKSCCKECCGSLDTLNEALYQTGQLFNLISSGVDSLSSLDLTDISFNFDTEIDAINTAATDGITDASNPCKGNDILPHLEAIQSKISQTNTKLESLFPDHTYDPYTSLIPNKAKPHDLCETIRKITCDVSSDEFPLISIPSSLTQIQNSIQQITQSLSNTTDFATVNPSLPALKDFIEKIQHDFQMNTATFEKFPHQNDQYGPVNICQTEYSMDDGSSMPTPCSQITPQQIITTSRHLDESFTSLLQTIQRIEHNQIHQKILQSLEMIRSCNHFLFSSPNFEKISCLNEFSTLLSKISTTCAQYPDLSATGYIYTDALLPQFNTFLESLKDTEDYLKELLLTHKIITPYTLSTFSPAFPASVEGTEALWNRINNTTNNLLDTIRLHDIHIPIDSIYSQLQMMNHNFQQIQWEKPVHSSVSAQLDPNLSAKFTNKIEALQAMFKDPGCCKIAAQNAQKLLKILTLLNAEDLSFESFTHQTACDLYQHIDTIMQNFSDTPQFLSKLTDELTIYYQNYYQKDCDFSDLMPDGSCQTLLETYQKITESCTTTTERILSLTQTVYPSSYDPALLATLELIRISYQKIYTFFDEIFIPAMTVSSFEIPTIDNLTDIPQCQTYCRLCHASMWNDEQSVLNIGVNLPTVLAQIPENMKQIPPALTWIKSKIQERQCDAYADLLLSNYQRLQFISEAIQSIQADSMDAQKIRQLRDDLMQPAAPTETLDDEFIFLTHLLEQLSGMSFIDTPSDPSNIIGHERIPALTFMINDCLQAITNHVGAVIPNTIHHFNADLQEALTMLSERLARIPGLFSKLKPHNSACDTCNSFVLDHLQLNIDPILEAFQSLKKRIDDPTCHHKLAVSLKSLRDKLSAFTTDHKLEYSQQSFTNLLNLLQVNTMCKSDEIAEALEALIQVFDRSFDLNTEVNQIETNQPDFNWTDSMNLSVEQIFQEISIVSDQIKQIADSIQHGDEIPAWIASFRALHFDLKDIYDNANFLPACTHPIHHSLIQIIQKNNLCELWKTIDISITEIEKNAHSHSYLPIIADFDRAVIKLYNHIQTIKEENGYQWFSKHYPPLLQVIENALAFPTQNDILLFLEQTSGIINQLNHSLDSLFLINSHSQHLISSEYGHPTASLQLDEMTQHFKILCSNFKQIASQKEWSEKHTAKPELSNFFKKAEQLIDQQLKNYDQLTNTSLDCEHCGLLDFSEMIQEQKDNLNSLKQDFIMLKKTVATCFACKELTPDLVILSNQFKELDFITNEIKNAKNPLNPENVIEVMNCIEPPLFSAQQSLDCTTAQIFMSDLQTRIKALNETLNRIYFNSSLNFEPDNNLLASPGHCSDIPVFTEQIKTYATNITKTVETITYDAMAPPADEWQPLINQNKKTLSQIVEQFLTQIIQVIDHANPEHCIGCQHDQLRTYFTDLTQAHAKTIQDIIALENAWNSYEFDKEIFPHLQNIYYFKALTHELVQWFTNNALSAQFHQIINDWNHLIQEIGPNLHDLELKELSHFQTLSQAINYSIPDFSSSNNSLEKLNHQLIQLPEIADQNFKIIDVIKEQLIANHYFDPSLDYLFQQATAAWDQFLTNFYTQSFKVGPHTLKIPADFAVFLSQLSQKWLDLSTLIKQQNIYCVEKAKKLQPIVSTLITIEAEFNALSQITNISKLNQIDLNHSFEALQELNQLMHVSSQQKKTCQDTSVLDELNQKLDAFRATLTENRHLLTQDTSDFVLASPDLIPSPLSPCESIEVSDQLIYYSIENIKSYIQTIYDQSVQNQSTIWTPQNTEALYSIAGIFQSISENLAALFNSWFCNYCPPYYRNICYQTNTENLIDIAQIYTDLYDNVKRRCCNERAQDSVILMEYFYNFAHHFSTTLAHSTLLNQPDETLMQQLTQTCHLLTRHVPLILDWIKQDLHQPLNSEDCKQFLHELEDIWSTQKHQPLTINPSLLGCEKINLCWFHIQSSMNEILRSITELHQKITSNIITPSLFEREVLQKIATFFYQTFESLKDYTPECLTCAQSDITESAFGCLAISNEIESLCAEKSNCCEQRLLDIQSTTQSLYSIQQSLETIFTSSKKTRLSDQTLKEVFEQSPLADFEENAVTKLKTLATLVMQFACKYNADFHPVEMLLNASNPCETLGYYIDSYKNSLANIKDLLNQMAACYITQDHISINSETADFITNLSAYISFLSRAPILDICVNCQNSCIETCSFSTTDAMDLTEDVDAIVESLSNKCCLFESKIIHQIGLSVETITQLFNQLTPQTFINCLNDRSSSQKWKTLNQSIQSTLETVMDQEASFAAHLVSSSTEEESADSTPPFLNQFMDHCQIITDHFKDCFNNPILAPSQFLAKLKYNCSQKIIDFQYIAEFLNKLTASFEKLSSAIMNHQDNFVYEYNPEIILTFQNFKQLISQIDYKISMLNHSACSNCAALMQLKAPREIFAPSFSLLPQSIDQLIHIISTPNCCNENTKNLLIFLGQFATIDFSFEKLANVWQQDQHPSLIGSESLNDNLEGILTDLTNIQDDFTHLINKNFEHMISNIIASHRLGNIHHAINQIYTAYTNDSIAGTIDGMQMYATIPPCERLNFTIYSLTHILEKLTNYFDHIQTFWNLHTPEYLPSFASKLSRLFTQLGDLKSIFNQAIANGFEHFSDCRNCVRPTVQEIQKFNLSFSQASLASIVDFYASLRCAKNSLKRSSLLQALEEMHQAVYHCVNFPVETIQTSVSVAMLDGDELVSQPADNIVNITNTSLLNEFMINWNSEIQDLDAIIQDQCDLFEENEAQPAKIDAIHQKLHHTAQQIKTDYNNLQPEHLLNPQLAYLPPKVHSCHMNIHQQKQIANAISEILLGYIKGMRWYLNQPYSFNIHVYHAALKFKEFLTHCYSMQPSESDCPYCQNYIASTQRDISSSIHQCMLENEQFLEKIKHPKCSLTFIHAFNAFNLALNDCVQQFAMILPLANKGDQYNFYKTLLNDLRASANKIHPELEQLKHQLSCLFLTLQIAHTSDVLCLSSIPCITEKLHDLTTFLNTSLHKPIHELSLLLHPGIANIVSDTNTNSAIIDTNSLSNQEKIDYIYLQILSSLNQLNDCFSQLEDDLKINSSQESFDYSAETIQIFEALQQHFSDIKFAILEFSNSEISMCLSTQKINKNPFFKDINAHSKIDTNLPDDPSQENTASKDPEAPSAISASLPDNTPHRNAIFKDIETHFNRLDTTHVSIINILKDRLWNTLLPGINNFITQNYSVNQKIAMLAANMGNFKILDSKICHELLPSLEKINKALKDQFSTWNKIITEDQPPRDIAHAIDEIDAYHTILNSFNTQALTEAIQTIAGTLEATMPGETPAYQLSKASLYSMQVDENMALISEHLKDQNDQLYKLLEIQIDESGNAEILRSLKNIKESIALLSPKIFNFFNAIQSTLLEISSDYSDCISTQATSIQEQLNQISSTFEKLALLFETGNCCKGLSNAYGVLITETRALSNRIQQNSEHFKIIELFNEDTGTTLDSINGLLKELFEHFYADDSKDIANCKASQTKFYLIPRPQGNQSTITAELAKIYRIHDADVASSSDSSLFTDNNSSHCNNLFNARNLFIEEMKVLEDAFYTLINQVEFNGLQASDNINFLPIILNKLATTHNIIEQIYLNRKHHTCNTCESDSDKDFFNFLSQRIHQLCSHINALQDVASNFCCNQATENMLVRCYSFTRNVSQQLQQLHQEPLDLIQIHSQIKTLIPVCAALYNVLQPYFNTDLHIAEKDQLIQQITSILESIDSSDTSHFVIKPFNRHIIPIYFTKITEQLESLPIAFNSFTNALQSISHAAYPELCASLSMLSDNVANIAQLFNTSSHANSLLHDEAIASNLHQQISATLHFLSNHIHLLHNAVLNNSKEKMIQKTVLHINASLQKTLHAIHILGQYIHHEIDFGNQTEAVIANLLLLVKNFPTLSTIAQAWVRIENETPVQSFDALNAALITEQNALEQTATHILSLTSNYHQQDASALTLYEADRSDMMTLNVSLMHIQQTILSMVEELEEITQTLQNATSRKFHADIIAILSTPLLEKLQQWENAYMMLARTLRQSGNTTYNVCEYADILQKIAQTIHHIPFKITQSIDALFNLEKSKKIQFLSEIAVRIHALTEGSRLLHASNTHLDQAKTFFNQFVPLSKQLVASYIQLQHTPAHSRQKENKYSEYLAFLDQLIQITQSTFNISISLKPTLETLHFDHAFLKEVASQIQENLDILFQNYQQIQNQWLIQAPYAIQPDLIKDCAIVVKTFKTIASTWHVAPFIDALHRFITQLHQPTCCQASSIILSKIEHHFSHLVSVLHQLTSRPIPVLDSEYSNLIVHLNAIAEYIGEAQDSRSICYNLAKISHLDAQDASYLENLSQIEAKVQALKSRFNAIAPIFHIQTIESPAESTLSNYCLQKEVSLSKIATHFRTLQQFFQTLTYALAPQIGNVRPYRSELVTFFNHTLSAAFQEFLQTFTTLQPHHPSNTLCQSCNKVHMQKYLTTCQNECASSIPQILRVVQLLETFKYSQINQFVHEIMIAQSYIEAELNTLIQNQITMNLERFNEMNAINTALSTLQSSWNAFIKTAQSSDTSAFYDPVQTLLESIQENYAIIQAKLSLKPQENLSVAVLYHPEIAYTTSNMEADCERIHQLSVQIDQHLETLYEQALKERPYNLSVADLFNHAYALSQSLYAHQAILNQIADPISHRIIQNFIPSAESLPLFRRLSFVLRHEECCEPYIERIQTIGSNFSELIRSIESLISITPFISIQTDDEAATVAQYLKASTSQPSSILQLLNHLRPSIQELIRQISLNFNPFCFASPDQADHLNLLNGIQQQITNVYGILSQINAMFRSTSNTPISLSELPNQIYNTNIYYDEQIASNWQDINAALKLYEQDIQTVATLAESRENWCILNDSWTSIRGTLDALKQIFKLKYYSEKALEAYNMRCCSLASDKLREISYYAATLSTIENLSLTNENINNATTRFKFISKNLIDISHDIQTIVGKSFHNRQTIFLLNRIKQSLINMSKQLNTRLNDLPPFNSQIETCETLIHHFNTFKDSLFGETSLLSALLQWGRGIQAARNGSAIRCYAPEFIETVCEISATLANLSDSCLSLNQQTTSFCSKCNFSIQNIFKNMSLDFKRTKEVFEAINQDLNQPTCCYEHEQDLIFLFSELNELEQLLSYCHQNSDVLINALNDPNLSNITQTIITAVQTFAFAEDDSYINPNLHCCAEFFTPHFHQFLHYQLAPFLDEMKEVLETLSGMHPNPTIYHATDPDNCKNVFDLSAHILQTFEQISFDMQALHAYFESPNICFYNLNFIHALRELLQLSWQIKPHIIPQEYFCLGCHRSFNNALTNLPTTRELQSKTMNEIDTLLGTFESMLNIMEKRWCKAQASAWNHFVDTAEFIENLVQNLLNHPFDDWKKETASRIQQPLVHLTHAYQQIETTLSTPLDLHQSTPFITALNTITQCLDNAGTRITQLFDQLAIPYEPFKATPTQNDFDSIGSNIERLCQNLDQTTLILSQNCHALAPDHIAILPTWHALNQAFGRFISKIEPACDCHFCHQIPVSMLSNALKGVDLQQQQWIQNLENINCCTPLQQECIEIDQNIRLLAQICFVSKEDAIRNLTSENAITLEHGIDHIIQCFASLEECLQQNMKLKQENEPYICAASRTTLAPFIPALKDLQKAFIETVSVYSPNIRSSIQNTSATPLISTNNAQIFDTLVNDFQYLYSQISKTFEYVNLAPVRDMHRSTLAKFAQLIEAFNTFYTHTASSILDMVNPCIYYDNCETRQIIAKIPPVLNHLQNDLTQESTTLEKMCCSRLSYQIYQFVDHLDIIRQAFDQIHQQDSQTIGAFFSDPFTQKVADQINAQIDPAIPHNISQQWNLVTALNISSQQDQYCAALSLEEFLNQWNSLLGLITSAPLNHLNLAAIGSQIQPPALYRCSEISSALNLGLNALVQLNTILDAIYSKIENTPFSYHAIFSVYKTFFFFDELLNQGKTMLNTLAAQDNFLFCKHCNSIQNIPLVEMQTAFESTQSCINALMTVFHKACDDDIARIVQERNLLLESFTQENITKDLQVNFEKFWDDLSRIDLNAIALNCQSIADELYEAYKDKQSNNTICLLPLVYDHEEMITKLLVQIFNSLMLNSYKQPAFSTIPYASYAESRANTLTQLENFNAAIEGLFTQILTKELEKSKPQKVATVNQISAIALKIQEIVIKEREIYTLWAEDTPCLRWTRCVACASCHPCLPDCVCQTNSSDVRLVLWKKSEKLDNLSQILINFSAQLIDDCCCETFSVFFKIPAQLISFQKIIDLWLKNTRGNEERFSEEISAVTELFKQLDSDINYLIATRNEARKKQERCNMDELKPCFEQMLANIEEYVSKDTASALEEADKNLLQKLSINREDLQVEPWTTEGNKCSNLEIVLSKIHEITFNIATSFEDFAQKIAPDATDQKPIINTQAILPLSELKAMLCKLSDDFSELEIANTSRSICAKCNAMIITSGISSITQSINQLSQNVLNIKNILFRQNCCVTLSQQLQQTNRILELISNAVATLPFNSTQSNTIALRMINPLTGLKKQLNLLIKTKQNLPDVTNDAPCVAETLVSPLKGLNDWLIKLFRETDSNITFELPSDLDLSAPFDCHNLGTDIQAINKTWQKMNQTVAEIFLNLQESNQQIFDRDFLSTMKIVYQLTKEMSDTLESQTTSSQIICLKCHEAATETDETAAEAIAHASQSLSQNSKELTGILQQFITALQNQCCYNIITSIEPILKDYAKFVLTIETLSSIESCGEYLNQKLTPLDNLIVSWNGNLEALNVSMNQLIQYIKRDDQTATDSSIITPEQEKTYITKIETIGGYVETISNETTQFAEPFLRENHIVLSELFEPLNTIKLNKASHNYMVKIFNTANKYTQNLSNSILRIKDSLLILDAQSSDIKLHINLLASRIQTLKLYLVSHLKGILPNKHMRQFMEAEDIAQLQAIWQPTERIMVYLTDSCHQLANIWMNSLCYEDLLSKVKIWTQCLNQSAESLNNIVSHPVNTIVMPCADTNLNRSDDKLKDIDKFFAQFKALSVVMQYIEASLNASPIRWNNVLSYIQNKLTPVICEIAICAQSIHTLLIENSIPPEAENAALISYEQSEDANSADMAFADPASILPVNNSIPPEAENAALISYEQPEDADSADMAFADPASILPVNNALLLNTAISPADRCQNISYIVRNCGQSIANFNASLMRFTYISSDLYQKFNVLPPIQTILELSQAQIILEKGINQILHLLPTLPLCMNANQANLLISSEFALQEMLKLVQNFKIIQQTLYSVQMKVLNNREAALSQSQLQGTLDGEGFLPIIDLMFQPQYDGRGFPRISATGEILADPASLYAQSHQTNAKSVHLYRYMFGTKPPAASDAARPV